MQPAHDSLVLCLVVHDQTVVHKVEAVGFVVERACHLQTSDRTVGGRPINALGTVPCYTTGSAHQAWPDPKAMKHGCSKCMTLGNGYNVCVIVLHGVIDDCTEPEAAPRSQMCQI